MADIEVVDNPREHRYEARMGGELAGFAAYELTSGVITFTHTEVDDAFEGKGVGSVLVRGALDAVRAGGVRKVRPLCPFVKAYIGRHPDYQDLLQSAADEDAR